MDRALVLRYQGIGFESQLARALKERQCTLKGQARYVNVRGSVHCKGVCRVGDRDLGVQNFFFGSGYFAVDGNLPLESILP